MRDDLKYCANNTKEEVLSVQHHFSVHKIRINRQYNSILFSLYFFFYFFHVHLCQKYFSCGTHKHIPRWISFEISMKFSYTENLRGKETSEDHMKIREICCDTKMKNKSFVSFRSRQIINCICYELCVAIYDRVARLGSLTLAHKR